MADVELLREFTEYKARYPEFFPPEYSEEMQLEYYKAIQARQRESRQAQTAGKNKTAFAPVAPVGKTVAQAPSNGKSQKSPKSKNGDDEPREYIKQPRAWFVRGGKLYLEVIDSIRDIPVYSYAVMNGGKVDFVDEIIVEEPKTDDSGRILVSGVKYVPRHLPMNKDGQPVLIVGIPERKIIESISHSDIGQIKERIINHIAKYCELSPTDLDLCTYYILTTWFYSTLSTIPYLRFRADTGKGKSRILKTISDLCFYTVRAGGASSASGTVRFADCWHGTLAIDEADLKGEADDSGGYTNGMIKFLNLGFEKGQYFIKSDKMDPKKQEVFDPFCPKVIAMRGVFQDPATEGRCLSISPSETERKDIPAILPAEYDVAAAELRAMMAHYTLTHWGIVSDADPYPSFNDVDCEHRLKQLGAPLAKVLSKIFPDGMALFKHYIERRQVEVKADRAASFVGNVVNALYDKALEQDVVYSSSIAEDLGVSVTKITKTLKDAGFAIEQRRVVVHIAATNTQDARTRTTVRKVIVVGSSRIWREISRRYIVSTETQNMLSNNLVACPVSIRSSDYVEN